MSREFIIGAMDLTPYFLRREREAYIFRDVPLDIRRSLIALTHWDARKVAVYINPKIYFCTTTFTSQPYPDGVLFRAYYQGDIHGFFVLLPKELRDAYWVEGV